MVFGGRLVEGVVRGLCVVSEDGIGGVFVFDGEGMWFDTSRNEVCGRLVGTLFVWNEGRGENHSVLLGLRILGRQAFQRN